jgi:GDP-mannose transporter
MLPRSISKNFKDNENDTLLPVSIEKDNTISPSVWTAAILACTMYCVCSVSMVLTNKAISTTIPIEKKDNMPQLSIIAFQCLIAVICVEGAKIFKVVEYPNFNVNTAKQWLPLNILFIGMLSTGFLALCYVSVPMVTITKNCSNLLTVVGDYYFFNES